MSELGRERSGTTLTLTLDRPGKMNALSGTLVEAMIAELEEAQVDGTRLVVLRGEGIMDRSSERFRGRCGPAPRRSDRDRGGAGCQGDHRGRERQQLTG